MKINKTSKKILDLLISSEPTIQGKAYDYYEILAKSGLKEIEYVEDLKYLSEINAIAFENGRINYFRLTALGRNYREFDWKDIKEFILKSILVPIIVSILTTSAIYALEWLLQR